MTSASMTMNTIFYWSATGRADWDTSTSWSSGIVPSIGDDAVIGGTSSYDVGISGTADTANSLLVSDPNAIVFQSGDLLLGGGLSVDGFYLLGLTDDGGEATATTTITAPGGIEIDGGGEIISRGAAVFAGSVVNNSLGLNDVGGLDVQGRLRITGALSGSGTTSISGLLEVDGAVTQSLAFTSGIYGGATLILEQPALFTGMISGVTPGEPPDPVTYLQGEPAADIIDLASIKVSDASYSGDLLVVTEMDGTQFSLKVTGSAPGVLQDATLTITDDGNGGTDILWHPGLTDTWIPSDGGDWSTPGNWSLGFAPGRFDTAVLGGSGTVTVESQVAQAYVLSLSSTVTLAITGRLSLGSTPDLNGATLALSAGGQLLLAAGGTLDSGIVTIADGSIIAPATIDPIAPASDFGAPPLTLGPSLSIVQQAGTTDLAQIQAGSVTNQGSIDASVLGGQFDILIEDPDSSDDVQPVGGFGNAGSLHVGNGDSFETSGASNFDNTVSGMLWIDGGATATLGGDSWSNEGQIKVGQGAKLTLQGDFAPGSVSGIVNTGGIVELDGVATQSGEISASGGLWIIDPTFALPGNTMINPGIPLTAGQSFTGAMLDIASGATLELRGVPAVYQGIPGSADYYFISPGTLTTGTITFDGAAATLVLDQPGDFSGTLANPTLGDTIDFAGTIITQADFDANGLSVSFNNASYRYNVQYPTSAPFWPDELTLSSDGNGGTDLLLHPDILPPAITAISATSDTQASDLDAGHVVTITLALREVVTVTGQPVLTLNDGDVATYVGGSGTAALTFTTTVQPGQTAADLTVQGLDFSNGSIADLGGNSLSASLPVGIGENLGLQVDTTAPTIVSVSTNPAEGVLHPGQTASIILQFSEPVLLSGGQLSLTLSTGGTATYDPAATAALDDPTKLAFRETVKPTETSASIPSITDVRLNGASLLDGAGNQADVSAAIGSNLGFGVDTAAVTTGEQAIFFLATPPGSGSQQVYASDGKLGGTVLLAPDGVTYTSPANITTTAIGTFFTASSTTTQSGVDNFGNPTTVIVPESLLLKTDGTSGGTTVVDTLQSFVDPYGGFSNSENFTALGSVGNTILVLATQTSGGEFGSGGFTSQTLYSSDGTSLTQLTTWSGFGSSYPASSGFVMAGSLSYFLAPSAFYSPGYPTSSLSLWQTDGTAGGTIPLNVAPESGLVDPFAPPTITDLTAAGSNLFFLSDNTLYTTQGTTATQVLSADKQPYYVAGMAAAGNDLYFVDPSGGLYYTDGTTAGTTDLLPEGTFIGAQNVVLAGNRLFILADAPGTTNLGVWSTTGSAASTVLLTPDGVAGPSSSLTASGGQAFFVANDATGVSRLWHTDGTLAGTQIVSPAGDELISPSDLVADGGKLVFEAYDAAHGAQLWQTDGTASGTSLVTNLSSTSQAEGATGSLVTIGNLTFFLDNDPVTDSQVLYHTDGTAAGTHVVTPSHGGYSGVSSFAAVGSLVYFTAAGANGNVLWQTDGTSAGTVAISDIGDFQIIAATPGGIFLADLAQIAVVTPTSPTPVVLDGQAYAGPIFATVGNIVTYTSNGQIWQTDGTLGGTQAVAGTTGAFDLTQSGSNIVFFIGQYGSATAIGQVQSGVASSVAIPEAAQNAYNLTAVGNSVYFTGGSTLWHLAGGSITQVSTADGSSVSPDGVLYGVGNGLFFTIYDSATGQDQLWHTDASSAEAKPVTTLSGIVSNVTTVGSQGAFLFFQTSDSAGGEALWKTDGSQAVEVLGGGGFSGFTYGGLATVDGTLIVSTNNQLYATTGTITVATPLTAIDEVNGSSPSDIVVTSAQASKAAMGVALDGYVSGGTVFADANGNGQWDPGEAITTTDGNGNFSLSGGSGPLVLEGGTDISTNLPFSGLLTAPSGSTVISPLTTIVEALASGTTQLSVTDAEQAVETALGLSLPPGTDLDDYDPIASLSSADPHALPVIVAGVEVQDTIALAAAALTGLDPSLSSNAAALDVVQAIAHATGSGMPLVLSSAGAVNAILVQAAQLDVGLQPPSAGSLQALASIIAASNSLAEASANTATPGAAFLQEAAIERVAQGVEADALHASSNFSDTAPSYTGAALAQSVAAALADVTPCYCPGTLILTNRGEVLVEALQVGDHVITETGAAEPVRWIGRRHYAGRFIGGNHLMLPVTIRAGAMADGVPHRDLTVSPGHGMVVNGQIVPAWRLINGKTITQADSVDEVQYLHVELHRHAILRANGTAAESFLEASGFRGQFHNAAEFYAQFPGEPAMTPLAARLEDGFALQRIQDHLAARAGVCPSIEPIGVLRGFVDQTVSGHVCGWAQDLDSPEEPVTLEVRVGGIPVMSVLANAYRSDLRRAGMGSGCHAFGVQLPAGLSGNVTVRRATDGTVLGLTDDAVRLQQLQAA